MGQPAAKKDDKIVGVCIHVVLVPQPAGGTAPVSLPHPFSGKLDTELSSNVKIEGKAAAMKSSIANNDPKHTPTPPGTSFASPPSNKATVQKGSTTVTINGKAAARVGDPAELCGGIGAVVGGSTVLIG